jgi:hypothetical protein
VQFACRSCGSPAVSIPEELNAAAAVQCARCGYVVGTWSELQALAREGKNTLLSADPAGDLPQVPADRNDRTLVSKVVEQLARAKRELTNGYRPERHYMRGPGPKSSERSGCDLSERERMRGPR